MMFPQPLCVILTIGAAAIPTLEAGLRFHGNGLIPRTLLLAMGAGVEVSVYQLVLGRPRPFVKPRNASRVTTLVLT
jgi:hypothetical protein